MEAKDGLLAYLIEYQKQGMIEITKETIAKHTMSYSILM